MLLYAVFTCGFILGGLFAAFAFGVKDSEEAIGTPIYTDFEANNGITDPDKLFEQITKINYQKTSLSARNSTFDPDPLNAI